jgi:hypothetical protein
MGGFPSQPGGMLTSGQTMQKIFSFEDNNMVKKTILVLLVISVCTSSISIAAEKASSMSDLPPVVMQTNPEESCKASLQEREGIIRAIEQYINAGRNGDSKIARKGFSNAATMSWSENNVLKIVPIKDLYMYFDEKPRKASCEIAGCSVAGDIAMARVESVFDDARFTDMFTLVKDGNDWKIVSKVYHVKK